MTVRRMLPDDPAAGSVEAMIDSAFSYYGGPYWRWKYASDLAPPCVIVIAEDGDQVVGCNHYVSVSYNLGKKGEARVLVAGDLLVRPGYRRQHLATELSTKLRPLAISDHPDAILVSMFTWPELGAYYRKLLGYTRVKLGFRRWSKRLTWKPAVDAIDRANEKVVARSPGLARVDHSLRIEFKGSPPLTLHVDSGGFSAIEVPVEPHFVVKVRRPDRILRKSKWLPLQFVIGLVTGDLRVSGSPRAMREAWSVRGAYLALIRQLR